MYEPNSAVHENLSVTIRALPAQADWLRRDLPDTIPDGQQRARVSVIDSQFSNLPRQRTPCSSAARSKALPDPDAAHALRRASENLLPGGRVLLVEEVFDTDDLDEHDAEEDLIGLTMHGAGLRTGAELDAVIARAGLLRNAAHTIGWGTTVHELARADTH